MHQLQTEIQALKVIHSSESTIFYLHLNCLKQEIYNKYKDAQATQQEQLSKWKTALTEHLEERVQLLTQQEENNNNHQIHLMTSLEDELKKVKDLILNAQPPPPPPSITSTSKTPPLSPAKNPGPPISAEVIENIVFAKLSQVMKNEISNLSNERNKQNEINLLNMHSKLQHSMEEKLQAVNNSLAEAQKK